MPFRLTAEDLKQKARELLGLSITEFDTIVADGTDNQIDVNSSDPANNGALALDTAGNVDEFNGEFDAVSQFTDFEENYGIETTGTEGDVIVLKSAKSARYIPGYEALAAHSYFLENQLNEGHILQAGFANFNDSGDILNGPYIEHRHDDKSLKLNKGGGVIQERNRSVWDNDPYEDFLDLTKTQVIRILFNWYGVGNFRPLISFTDDNDNQINEFLDKISEPDEFSTEEINLRPFVRLECTDGSAEAQAARVGTMEYKTRGQGEGNNRTKKSHEFNVTGGNISTDKTGLKVIRIDPSTDGIVCDLTKMEIDPDENMQVAAIGVNKSQLSLQDSDFSKPNFTSSTNSITQVAPFSAIDQTEITNDIDDMNGARQLALVGQQSGSGGVFGTDAAPQDDDIEAFFTNSEYVVFIGEAQANGADTDLQFTITERF